MAWPPTEEDRRQAFAEDGTWFENNYICSCGCAWTDEWSCMSDDDCPQCGTTCSPVQSIEIPFEDEDACRNCGAVEGTPEYGTVGDGFDGLCPSCADKAEEKEHHDVPDHQHP